MIAISKMAGDDDCTKVCRRCTTKFTVVVHATCIVNPKVRVMVKISVTFGFGVVVRNC